MWHYCTNYGYLISYRAHHRSIFLTESFWLPLKFKLAKHQHLLLKHGTDFSNKVTRSKYSVQTFVQQNCCSNIFVQVFRSTQVFHAARFAKEKEEKEEKKYFNHWNLLKSCLVTRLPLVNTLGAFDSNHWNLLEILS